MNFFLPVDFHCHGIGRFDFASPDQLVLDELETHLRIEGVRSILTLYLPKSKLAAFENFVKEYSRGKLSGRYTHIVGIALEGPVLASFGGTPEKGCWHPTKAEWARIAALGPDGLIYVVISPDAQFPPGAEYPPGLTWVLDLLISNQVKPAFGHFKKDNPARSAETVHAACEYLKAQHAGPGVTDHLFNDMPLNFNHSFRVCPERKSRKEQIDAFLATPWTDANIEELLGPVPAALIKYAKEGLLRACLNFDGDHVDIDICRRTVEFVGADNLLLMTDRIQSMVLGGQQLHFHPDNTLMYQSQGIVAGGTQSLMRQLGNMLLCGIPSPDIAKIAYITPSALLGLEDVSESHRRVVDLPVHQTKLLPNVEAHPQPALQVTGVR